MIYKDLSIPAEFNKIAEISDNYIVFVRESNLVSTQAYNAYIQFINPSFGVLYISNYTISNGNCDIIYNYRNDGFYNYIESADVTYTKSTMQYDLDNFTSNDTAKNDYITIFVGQFLVCVCILWVFKQMSRLFFRGGLW